MKQPVVLRIYKGDALEAVRQFEHSQIVIGRNSDVQLALNDENVALLHAMIEDRGEDYYLSDLGSQSGTFKNGNRVLEDKLNSGDQITIGPYRIQFFVGVPKPAAPPKPTIDIPLTPPNSIAFSPVSAPTPPPSEAPRVPTEMPTLEEEKAEVLPPVLPQKPPVTKPTPLQSNGASPVAPVTPAVATPRKPQMILSPLKPSHKTFAPPSAIKDLREVIKPGKGSVVEVVVAWKDRILSTNHFKEKGSVFISASETADVVVPNISSKSRYELVKIGTSVTVCLTQEMVGELIRDGETLTLADLARQNKLRNSGTHFELDLRQGEMVRLGLQENLISIYIRFKPDTPKPLVAPLMDMTSSEVTGVILALLVAGIGWFYMNIFTPSPLAEDEARVEEPIRKAIVKFNPPAPKQIVEAKEEPKKIAKAVEKPKASPTPSVEKKGEPGKAGEVAPKPDSKNKEKKLTSAKPGGAVKTAPKEGANLKSEKPDPTKVGLMGTFSKNGMQSKLDKVSSGSGELAGMADQATGYAGNAENRDGENLGTKLKDTGAGGKGSATIGIAGVGTQGRGTGTTGYGSGGIGQKGSVQVNVGGQEGDGFATSMDREAIRRVIREHLREIRSCYEHELQSNPDLYGKVVLEWYIEDGGRVTKCNVKSNALSTDKVANCIAAHLKTWKFPDPPKNMVGQVSYPFVFSSQ